MTVIWIALFGVAGVLTRHALNQLGANLWIGSWPVITFSINIFGSFLIGSVYVLGIERGIIAETWRVAIMVGFLGGFTTFSSYSLELVQMLEAGRHLQAWGYMAASTLLGLGAAALGMCAFRRVF